MKPLIPGLGDSSKIKNIAKNIELQNSTHFLHQQFFQSKVHCGLSNTFDSMLCVSDEQFSLKPLLSSERSDRIVHLATYLSPQIVGVFEKQEDRCSSLSKQQRNRPVKQSIEL